jgi:hypothetical protein
MSGHSTLATPSMYFRLDFTNSPGPPARTLYPCVLYQTALW